MSLDAVRDAIDACGDVETAVFARRTRNAIAMALVAQRAAAPPDHRPPVAELRRAVGSDLADVLVDVYEGGPEWTSRAIDALEPLHALVRR